MEEEVKVSTSEMLKSASMNGVYVSLVPIVIAVLIFVMNPSFIMMGVLGILSFILTYILVVVLSIKYRKEKLDNRMKYADALVYTLVVGLVASIISSVFSAFYQYVIDPSYIDNMAVRMQNFMEAQNVPQAQVDEAIDEIMKAKEVGAFLVSQLKSILIFNLLIILFAPLFVKKSAPVF
ncbi:DUF4199 domain-containing protein [Acetobacteroides hydrogenigenes]|uniref:Uncharacterized protein DUF4199 n=1 Tax=Acetobacteroides hydrogenigenes TaxID=979970 RepID=A0A4V2RNZ4_9BACT|nr:DUF4199 domain-containing protein [Acetobacteroides hydrogenigenes]TCN65620.1 uncharacterized protein DUF4199 [Acetobacteroides hydrogenigenes]